MSGEKNTGIRTQYRERNGDTCLKLNFNSFKLLNNFTTLHFYDFFFFLQSDALNTLYIRHVKLKVFEELFFRCVYHLRAAGNTPLPFQSALPGLTQKFG